MAWLVAGAGPAAMTRPAGAFPGQGQALIPPAVFSALRRRITARSCKGRNFIGFWLTWCQPMKAGRLAPRRPAHFRCRSSGTLVLGVLGMWELDVRIQAAGVTLYAGRAYGQRVGGKETAAARR